MITGFSFPTQIRFGVGAIEELPGHLQRLQCRRPLVVTDPGLLSTEAFQPIARMAGRDWPIFSAVHPNPIEEDVEAAARSFTENGCDAVIAFGGGSALDVGKVIRLRIRRPAWTLREFSFDADWSGLAPCIAIPTTAGTGSEVGRSSVIILDHRKAVFFHPSLLATVVILDPELTRSLPPKLTAATGADALTHCIESFTSPTLHPLCDGIALEGIHLIHKALPKAVAHGKDLEARGQMQLAAMMGGIAFQKDLGATHSLAHPLSSICGLHHGLANALCLPAVMEWNAAAKPGLYRRVAIAMDLPRTDDAAAIGEVRRIFSEIGISPGLKAHGVAPQHLKALADQAFADGCHQTNPVPVTREDLYHLYQKCM